MYFPLEKEQAYLKLKGMLLKVNEEELRYIVESDRFNYLERCYFNQVVNTPFKYLKKIVDSCNFTLNDLACSEFMSSSIKKGYTANLYKRFLLTEMGLSAIFIFKFKTINYIYHAYDIDFIKDKKKLLELINSIESK